MLRLTLLLLLLGCSSVADDPEPPKPEPRLAATCAAASECPTGYLCYEIGCIRECASNEGCPVNGHCLSVDPSVKPYCALTCKADTDCKSVNAKLACRDRAGKMVCVTP